MQVQSIIKRDIRRSRSVAVAVEWPRRMWIVPDSKWWKVEKKVEAEERMTNCLSNA